MASLEAIRAGLASTIQNGVQSTLFAYSSVADLVELPAIIVEPSEANFEEAMNRGCDAWYINVFVLCSKADETVGQSQLDGFVSGSGPDSIRQAIFNRSDLNLQDTDATVIRMGGYGGSFDSAKVPLVGAILRVRVYTDGRA